VPFTLIALVGAAPVAENWKLEIAPALSEHQLKSANQSAAALEGRR
jgi:hypothetical protein